MSGTTIMAQNFMSLSGHLNRQNKDLNANGSLMKVESIAECSPFCNTFDLHKEIIGLKNQVLAFLRVAI